MGVDVARVRHEDSDDEVVSAARPGPLGSASTPDDVSPEMTALRPTTLGDFVGQGPLKERLAIYVQAAREREEALDHVLFHGPPGLGKTTLARILARELDVAIHETSGPALEHKGLLAGHLTSLRDGDVMFIDEIHRLTPTVEESLYAAMEDRRIDLPMGEGSRAKTMAFHLPAFTLIGATTRTALLSAPLRERFQIVESIEFYSDDELASVVARSAALLGFPTTEEGALEIGRRSRGTPRIANNLVRRVRDFAQVAGRRQIDRDDAAQGLARLGIDPHGLDDIDRRILTTITEAFRGGPVGIEALAATLGIPRDTLEDMYEPFLLQRGFLVRTPRGREITDRALGILGLELSRVAAKQADLWPED